MPELPKQPDWGWMRRFVIPCKQGECYAEWPLSGRLGMLRVRPVGMHGGWHWTIESETHSPHQITDRLGRRLLALLTAEQELLELQGARTHPGVEDVRQLQQGPPIGGNSDEPVKVRPHWWYDEGYWDLHAADLDAPAVMLPASVVNQYEQALAQAYAAKDAANKVMTDALHAAGYKPRSPDMEPLPSADAERINRSGK